MKSLDNLTNEELLATSVPFNPPRKDIIRDWASDLSEDYSEEQLHEINSLVGDVASETLVRLVQFLLDAKTDKQIIARLICLNKMFDNRHGGWSSFSSMHKITPKSVRAERDRIESELGIHIR